MAETPPPASPPSPTPAPGPGAGLERQTLDALKAIGKALGQMALYKVGHPAVAATISAAQDDLAAALALASGGELAVGVDRDKLILNGRVVGTLGQLPASLANLFNRFKLSSLTFRAGLGAEELIAFCELAASRPDSPAAADPKGFLAGRGVGHIVFNEAVYLKAGDRHAASGPGASGGAAAGAGGAGPGGAGSDASVAPADSEAQIDDLQAAIATGSLERTIMALVEKAVPDPMLRQKVLQQVMKLLETDIARRVDEVTLPLRREKKTLENERVRTDSVLNNMVSGVVVVDDQGKILMMNPAAEQIFGSSLASAAGKGLLERSGEQFIVTLASELQTPADRAVSVEVSVKGEDDTKRTLRASSAVVKTEEGRVVGMVSSLPDAAKHRELQKMQRDFVAHVTHELRAPLSSIRAALEILEGQSKGKINEEEQRMLNAALKNSDRLAELINGILDFSKIESGQMTVTPKPCDPERVAREAVDSLIPWAQKKRVELTLSAPAGLPLVEADGPRTIQVLINLLSNAIKFTPAGGRIAVRLAKRAQDNLGFVEFSVADTGPGIPKADQAKVFEKFVQIASGEAHVGGTGLGLSIAKALVHLQKGRLWLESETGQGCNFLFTLPAHAAASAETHAMRAKPAAAASPPWWKKFLRLN